MKSCFSFQVRKRYQTGRLELFRRERKCLHHYLYLIDPEFGFMLVRIQGWIPYECGSRACPAGWGGGECRRVGVRLMCRLRAAERWAGMPQAPR
ncbi:MAG TPA: hypothetical protein VFG96_04340 [Jiangellaceae bacterium]|nr:hypothetical protein [Jiangellaceae bacterium]